MADEAEVETNNSAQNPQTDEVFQNGEEDSTRNNNLLNPEYNMLPEQVLPRRSSLLKDGSKRAKDRKKTVSFSSMPNEKTVVNGKCTFCCQSTLTCSHF